MNMAIMYPDKPKSFEPNSGEDLMFSALESLPDSYYVFHSFSIVTVKDGVVYESEADFVVYNESKGIMCLEAKNGQVSYSEGYWRYGSGKIMANDGPYRQVANNKWKLRKYMTETLGLWDVFSRCKMVHAVWFPAVKKEKFKGISLPAESDLNLTLTQESEDDLEAAIASIFDLKLPNQKENKLSHKDTDILLNKVFAPTFSLISIAEMKHDHYEHVFKKMEREQVALLNYLEEQNEAVINGMAGTGKTVMAVKKAISHAERGDKVLFLCYNVKLKEHLQDVYSHENVFYYTIDGLACKLCNTAVPDYKMLRQTLSDMYGGGLPFQHVIIDEGQDFELADEMDIINLLKMNVLDDESKNGSFYLFYDKNQMVQSRKAPEYIDQADCRLTLYRNCRNTFNIATTSMRLLGSEKKPKLLEGALEGELPELFVVSGVLDTVKNINAIIDSLWESDYKDIQILTAKTEESSIITDECSTGVYTYKGKKIPFTTCRRFKGLEAEAILLVDITKELLAKDGDSVLYVGASRAKYRLMLICDAGEEDCIDILTAHGMKKNKKPEKAMAAMYNAKFREAKSEDEW